MLGSTPIKMDSSIRWNDELSTNVTPEKERHPREGTSPQRSNVILCPKRFAGHAKRSEGSYLNLYSMQPHPDRYSNQGIPGQRGGTEVLLPEL